METIGGQIVAIVIPRLAGGQPLYVPCVVAEPDPTKAENIVKQHISHGEDIKAVGPVTEQYVQAFGLKGASNNDDFIVGSAAASAGRLFSLLI